MSILSLYLRLIFIITYSHHLLTHLGTECDSFTLWIETHCLLTHLDRLSQQRLLANSIKAESALKTIKNY